MRRAYLLVATVFFCGQAVAQTVTIDLDRLSKVSYCLGVDTEFQKKMAVRPGDPCTLDRALTDEIQRSQEAACAAQRDGVAELKRKVDLYKLYIIVRIDISAALFTSTVSMSDGTADVGRCYTAAAMLSTPHGACPSPVPFDMKLFNEQQSCMERNIPPACRRVRECANLDMP